MPGIDAELTDAPPLRNCLASSATAVRERVGLLDEITTAARSSSRLEPLAKIPAEPIQLAKSAFACGVLAPRALSGVIIAPRMPLRLSPALLSGPAPLSVLISEPRL